MQSVTISVEISDTMSTLATVRILSNPTSPVPHIKLCFTNSFAANREILPKRYIFLHNKNLIIIHRYCHQHQGLKSQITLLNYFLNKIYASYMKLTTLIINLGHSFLFLKMS